jgi:hypothetical protein
MAILPRLPAPAAPGSSASIVVSRPGTPASTPSPGYEYDVAISFAGTERALAERFATIIRDAGARVFYDGFYEEQLWGKDLPVFLGEVYRSKARYCVIFVSHEYAARNWTNHERQHAVARALQERGDEYILPIKVDDAELAGVSPTLGYISLRERPIEGVAELLLRKLHSAS